MLRLRTTESGESHSANKWDRWLRSYFSKNISTKKKTITQLWIVEHNKGDGGRLTISNFLFFFFNAVFYFNFMHAEAATSEPKCISSLKHETNVFPSFPIRRYNGPTKCSAVNCARCRKLNDQRNMYASGTRREMQWRSCASRVPRNDIKILRKYKHTHCASDATINHPANPDSFYSSPSRLLHFYVWPLIM